MDAVNVFIGNVVLVIALIGAVAFFLLIVMDTPKKVKGEKDEK